MSWHPFRLKLRWMLLAIAILGLVMGAEIGRRRRVAFLQAAEFHRMLSYRATKMAENWTYYKSKYEERIQFFKNEAKSATNQAGSAQAADASSRFEKFIIQMQNVIDADKINARFHQEMLAKYERASRFPWYSVAPDPTEPPYLMAPETK